MPSDSPLVTSLKSSWASNPAAQASVVPPGMGELNYIQTLLAGLIDQQLYTSSTPTFVSTILSGLTASQMVATDANKKLVTATVGTSLSLSGGTINTIQGLRAADSPSFTGITIGSLSGILKAAAGVVAAATIGNSLSYSAPTLDAIQDIRTSASPTHTGLTLSGLSTGGMVQSLAGVLGLCSIQANLTWSSSDSTLASLLHLNGTDQSTTFTDVTGKTWTATGAAKIVTAQSKFGGASLSLSGSSCLLSTPDHADFYFSTGDLTLDCWVRFAAFPTSGNWMNIFSQKQDSNNFMTFGLGNFTGTHKWDWEVKVSNSDIIRVTKQPTGNLNLNQWYHIALAKASGNYYIFQDGTQVGTTQADSTSVPDFTGNAVIGAWDSTYGDLNGWIDEFRLSKVARWTAGFTPPSAAYTANVGLNTAQDLLTTSSPAFTGLTVSGLTASVPVVTDANKLLASVSYATFKSSLAIAQADVTGLHTADSPTFAGATIGTLAGIIKGTAGVLSALALGTKNHKLFVNEAANNIEWAAGIKSGTFTHDVSAADGDQVITGVGFTPSLIMFTGGVNGTTMNTYLGFFCGPTSGTMANWSAAGTPGQVITSNSYVLLFAESVSKYAYGGVTAMSSDGFTISWVKVGSPASATVTVTFFAIR